jgi:PLP dependent protein
MPETAQGSDELRGRLAEVRRQIGKSARACGRDPDEVKLVAVSKTHPPDALRVAIEAGVSDFGENRVQEADVKIEELGRQRARWHLIGHLQANKARRAVALFDLIHSLDSVALALRLDRLCAELNRAQLPLLVQVDLGGEATKSGINERDLPELIETIRDCSHLRLMGLMTLPPFFDDPEMARPFFRRLRGLRDEFKEKGLFREEPGELSMGMSHDFEVAIEEGATLLRIGTAIFGERGKPLA